MTAEYPAGPRIEGLVDDCVDLLLAGRDWRPLVASPGDQTAVDALMQVADRLVTANRRSGTPPLPRERLWQRIARRLPRAWSAAVTFTAGVFDTPAIHGGLPATPPAA